MLSKQSFFYRVRSTLIEATLGFFYSFTVSFLMDRATKWTNNPYTFSAGVVATNFLLRLPKNEKVTGLCYVGRTGLFAYLDLITRNLVLHEGGHALIASWLFKGEPNISLHPGFINYSGYTTKGSSELTNAGEKFGRQNSDMVFSASGTGITLLANILMLIAAEATPDIYKEVKTCLRFAVLFNVVNTMVYAFSAYGSCENYNDFCALQKEGIPPVAAALGTLAVMLVMQIGLSCVAKCIRHKARPVDVEAPEEIELTERSRLVR